MVSDDGPMRAKPRVTGTGDDDAAFAATVAPSSPVSEQDPRPAPAGTVISESPTLSAPTMGEVPPLPTVSDDLYKAGREIAPSLLIGTHLGGEPVFGCRPSRYCVQEAGLLIPSC
jgi:hypothetical protein